MDSLQQQLARYEASLAKWRRISLRNRQALAISTTKEAVYTERIRHMKALAGKPSQAVAAQPAGTLGQNSSTTPIPTTTTRDTNQH